MRMLRPALLAAALAVVFSLTTAVGCGGEDNVDFGGSGGASGAAAAGASGGASGSSGAGATAAASGQGGAAAAGGVAGAPGGGAGAAGVAGSGGATGPEDCVNGIDDNGDGLADCADPKCQPGYVCAPTPPQGWQGIGWIDAQPGAACPAGFDPATDLYELGSLVAPPAGCACGCGAPEGVGCATHLICNAGDTCWNTGSSVKGVSSGCTTYGVPAVQSANACRAETPQAFGGQCVPSVTTTFTAPTWTASQRGCVASASGSCANAGELCVPRLPDAKGPCIAQAGDLLCPEGAYSEKTLFFDGQWVDERGCDGTACTCGGAKGGSCACAASGCRVQVYGADNCMNGTIANVPADSTSCITFQDGNNLNGQWGVRLNGASVSSPGTCGASGTATPIGSITPSVPVTVCCVK